MLSALVTTTSAVPTGSTKEAAISSQQNGQMQPAEVAQTSKQPVTEQVSSASHSDQVQKQQALDNAVSRDMARRDREVKTHEQTHAAVGAPYTSAPSFTYERGPDGQLYAVEGQVRIDTSKIADDPHATLEKAEVIIRASLSVSDPSPQDRRVAAEARAMAAEARSEIAQQAEPTETDAAEKTEQDGEEAVNRSQADSDESDKKRTRLSEEREQSNQAAAESLAAFNQRLNDIQKTLQKVNQRLVDAGVFEKLFPEGSVIDRHV